MAKFDVVYITDTVSDEYLKSARVTYSSSSLTKVVARIISDGGIFIEYGKFIPFHCIRSITFLGE